MSHWNLSDHSITFARWRHIPSLLAHSLQPSITRALQCLVCGYDVGKISADCLVFGCKYQCNRLPAKTCLLLCVADFSQYHIILLVTKARVCVIEWQLNECTTSLCHASCMCSVNSSLPVMVCVSITTIVKTYGAHLKASAATVRLRLYDVLALLPPETYEGRLAELLLILL